MLIERNGTKIEKFEVHPELANHLKEEFPSYFSMDIDELQDDEIKISFKLNTNSPQGTYHYFVGQLCLNQMVILPKKCTDKLSSQFT